MDSTIADVISAMLAAGQHRSYIVFDEGRRFRTSHNMFDGIASAIVDDKRDFNQHEAIFLEVSPSKDALFSATLWRTVRGQGAGGVRYWPSYDRFADFLSDGLRLSQGMGRKNALAGLYWGGGKGVIASVNSRLSPDRRRALFEDYGSFITSLDGCYVTAEDVGVGNQDMMAIFSKTRFTTCIPGQVGGSGNPSVATGTGVVCAVEAALDWRNRGDALAGKSVAIQGAGNVAQSVIANLLRRNVDYVKVTDISPDTLAIASAHAKRHDNGKSVVEFALSSRGDNSILSEDVDVVIPCALGGVLNQGTIPKIKAPIVCGAANNQLLDEETDAVSITEKGIVFVPDFIANRMGIVTCANEQYGYVSDDPAITRHFGRDWDNSIWKVSQSVLDRAKAERIPTAIAAKRIADELAAEPHPIWGHRCKQIVESLVARRWHRQHAANH